MTKSGSLQRPRKFLTRCIAAATLLGIYAIATITASTVVMTSSVTSASAQPRRGGWRRGGGWRRRGVVRRRVPSFLTGRVCDGCTLWRRGVLKTALSSVALGLQEVTTHNRLHAATAQLLAITVGTRAQCSIGVPCSLQ